MSCLSVLRWPLAFVLNGAALLGAAPGVPAGGFEDGTYWFSGTEERSTLDGRIPYGSNQCVLRIEVGGHQSTWVETALQPGDSPSGPPRRQVVTLRRLGTSMVFAPTGDPDGPAGYVTFDDPTLTSWRYHLELKPSGFQTGTGSWSASGVAIRMVLENVPTPMVIQWTLHPVSRSDYESKVRNLYPRPGSE